MSPRLRESVCSHGTVECTPVKSSFLANCMVLAAQRITKVRATFSLEEKDYTLTPMSLVIGHLKASFITENQKSATHIPHHGQYGRVIHSTRFRKCLLDIKMGIRDRQENSLFIKQLTLCLI